jgi:hypothetical protein
MIVNQHKSNGRKIIFVEMNRQEALATIKSLSEQLLTGDPNTGRYEKDTKDGEYFSIAVMENKQ